MDDIEARRVSIHAPVKGATPPNDGWDELALKFQSTRP